MVARPLVHSLHRWSLEEDVTLLRAAAVMVCRCRWLLFYVCEYVIVYSASRLFASIFAYIHFSELHTNHPTN